MSTNLVLPDNRLVLPSGVSAPPPPQPRTQQPLVQFSEEEADKAAAFELLGDLDDIHLPFNDVLVLKYIRGNISQFLIAASETQREDRWQGTVGLVMKLGDQAFKDDPENKVFFHGFTVERGQWVWFRNSDGWDQDIQERYGRHQFAECRLIQDAHIKGVLKYPGRVTTSGRI